MKNMLICSIRIDTSTLAG